MAKKANILVVDDELSVLESFKLILGIREHVVLTAQNLDQAISAVKQNRIALAFIDLRFQGKDIGLDILKKLKELSPRTAAVIVTAFSTEATKQAAFELGAVDYISKPFMMETIFQTVDKFLGVSE